MLIDIKHKHASHVIIIEGQAFKANDAGQWDLTDIWRTLKLPKGKQPGKWADIKKAQALRETGNIGFAKDGAVTQTLGSKRATLAYAAWVSEEFETMVYDAFEAILEMPEVALLVANKMRSMGNDHSAAILERHFSDNRCDWSALKGFKKAPKRPLSPAEKERQSLTRAAKRYEDKNPTYAR